MSAAEQLPWNKKVCNSLEFNIWLLHFHFAAVVLPREI
jgi:hypothetical protein